MYIYIFTIYISFFLIQFISYFKQFMTTLSFKNGQKEEEENKAEIRPSPNQGCGCCERCKMNQPGIIPVRPFLECDKHRPYLCAYCCLDCNVPICLKCTKQQHNKHTIGDIFELNENASSGAGNQGRGPYFYPKATVVGSRAHNCYEVIRRQANKQAEILHNIVTDVLQEALNSVDEMELRDADILEKYENELKSRDAKIDGNKDAEVLYQRDEEVSSDKNILSGKINFRAPRFLKGMPSTKEINAQFGIIKPSVIDRRTSKDRELLSKPKPLFEIDSQSKYTLYVRYFHSNKILQSGTGLELYVLNEKGECLETIQTVSGIDMPAGLTVLDDGTILYTDYRCKRVRRIKSDRKIEEFATTEGKPNGICGTRSGEIIVCLQDCHNVQAKVVWFDHFGNLLREYTHVYLSGPTSVYENINNDICITDENMRNIMVIDKDLDIRFVYDGNISTGDVSKFTPRDICCDSIGHILVADFTNRVIHLLDEDGHFICYILTKADNLSYPHGLCVDKEDRLWVAERFSKKIKVFQYLS